LADEDDTGKDQAGTDQAMGRQGFAED